MLLMFGAEALGGGREAGRRLLQRLAVDEHSAEPVPGLEAGDLLTDPGVARVGCRDGAVVQRLVGDEPIDAAPLMFELGHRLLEGVALDTDEVLGGHADVVEIDLAEVPVGGHVGDRADLDAGEIHRHDQLRHALVRWPVARCATDQVAVVGVGCEGGPDLLAVDDEHIAVANRRRLEAGEIGAGIGLGHADAPGGLAAEHAGEEFRLLVLGAVGEQCRTHLSVGEPAGGDRCTSRDHGLSHDDAGQVRLPATAVFDRPRHADPPLFGEAFAELLGVTVDPGVGVHPVVGDTFRGDLPGADLQFLEFGGQFEVEHRGTPPCMDGSEPCIIAAHPARRSPCTD